MKIITAAELNKFRKSVPEAIPALEFLKKAHGISPGERYVFRGGFLTLCEEIDWEHYFDEISIPERATPTEAKILAFLNSGLTFFRSESTSFLEMGDFGLIPLNKNLAYSLFDKELLLYREQSDGKISIEPTVSMPDVYSIHENGKFRFIKDKN